jgi:hypothetical protein
MVLFGHWWSLFSQCKVYLRKMGVESGACYIYWWGVNC